MNKQTILKLHRILAPIIDIRALAYLPRTLWLFGRYLKDYFRYKKVSLNESVLISDLYPCVNDRVYASSSGKGHYFYQDIWGLRKVAKSGVKKHFDVGSRIDGFVGQCSIICEIEFLDLRPVDLGVENLSMKTGDVLHLPYPDDSIMSLSCLHVLEHIGLGRYGDSLCPTGSQNAAKELARTLAPGGNLYVSFPIGRERVEFNAHRVFAPLTALDLFQGLELVEFAAVDDRGFFTKDPHPLDFVDSDYACGLFHFSKSVNR